MPWVLPPPVKKSLHACLPDGRGEHFRNYGYLKLTIPYNMGMKIKQIRDAQYLRSSAEALTQIIAKYSAMGFPADIIHRLEQLKAEYLSQADRLQDAFDSISDSEIRKAIILYSAGRTWGEIYFLLYGYNSFDHGGTIRRRCERHLAKL